MNKSDAVRLSPAQARALSQLEHGLTISRIAHLSRHPSHGDSTVLAELHRRIGGTLLHARDFTTAACEGAPNGVEESFFKRILAALAEDGPLLIDDLSSLNLGGCGGYPRGEFWSLTTNALLQHFAASGKTIVVCAGGREGWQFRNFGYGAAIERFEPDDYAALLETFLGAEQAAKLNVAKIHRFAPNLDCYDLKSACAWMKSSREEFGTEQFIDYLRSQHLASNVDLGEVQSVDLRSLIGVDNVIRSLETHIVLPFENDALAAQYGLKPKRGVLLYGPPGTGKTTVGRALAHRLRGKFFLVDGTFIAGSQDFYVRIHKVFDAAKNNSPAVIFIDDADAIFQNDEEQGLYRYLLTMLDGLESEGRQQVCVMLTAMNVSDLPAALVRSGRVELWLEMKLPDAAARRGILALHAGTLPDALSGVNFETLADATDGLTGADLKRLVEDAKALHAYAQATNAVRDNALAYFTEAIATIRANKEAYMRALEGKKACG